MNKDLDDFAIEYSDAQEITLGVKGYGNETRGTRMGAPIESEG